MADRLTHLLDTSIYSQPIKNHANEAVLQRWSAMDDRLIAVSAVCHFEVLAGLRQRNSRSYWDRYRAILEHRHRILPFDEACGTVMAELHVALSTMGKPRPLADLMIAATARAHGLILVTLNTKDFAGIPGLEVEDWSR